jgi:hypothetical protein
VKNLRGPAAVTGIDPANAIAELCEKARDQKVRKPEDLLPALNFTFAGRVGGWIFLLIFSRGRTWETK